MVVTNETGNGAMMPGKVHKVMLHQSIGETLSMSAGIKAKETNVQTNEYGETDSLTQAIALTRQQNDSFNGNFKVRKASDFEEKFPETRTNTSVL